MWIQGTELMGGFDKYCCKQMKWTVQWSDLWHLLALALKAWHGKMYIASTASNSWEYRNRRAFLPLLCDYKETWWVEPGRGMRKGRGGPWKGCIMLKGGVIKGVEWHCRPSIKSISWQQGQQFLLSAQHPQLLLISTKGINQIFMGLAKYTAPQMDY